MAIIQLTITVPDAAKDAIIDDFCFHHGYKVQLEDAEGNLIPNPQTKPQFMKAKVIAFIRESVRAARANRDSEVARLAASAAVDSISIT